VERRKGKRYGSELRRQAVERMNACGNVVGLARELGVSRRVLYQWRDRMEQTDSSPGRSREIILRKQILKLKRLLANKTLEVDFFRHALQRVGARRRQNFHPGALQAGGLLQSDWNAVGNLYLNPLGYSPLGRD
jgi:transposase-like protein